MIKHSIEWNEILGDMIDEVTQFQENEVRDLMADEAEMDHLALEDWYQSLLIESENFNDHKGHSL